MRRFGERFSSIAGIVKRWCLGDLGKARLICRIDGFDWITTAFMTYDLCGFCVVEDI